jgi:hypothetical protein
MLAKSRQDHADVGEAAPPPELSSRNVQGLHPIFGVASRRVEILTSIGAEAEPEERATLAKRVSQQTVDLQCLVAQRVGDGPISLRASR